jgi:DNA-directed RNA polymerase specialized sigma24 family protein
MTTVSTAVDIESAAAALSRAEVVAAIRALSDGDKTALMKIARVYARKTPYSHEDLCQEALCRVLSGARAWPRDLPTLSFLVGVVRSIASEWKSEPLGEVSDAADPRTGEGRTIASIDVAKIVALFADDPVAQTIVVGIMEGARGQELMALSGLNRTDYESKRTKIRRRIEKLST